MAAGCARRNLLQPLVQGGNEQFKPAISEHALDLTPPRFTRYPTRLVGLQASLVQRVCNNDRSLIFANDQRNFFHELHIYLGHAGDGVMPAARGPLMCILALFAFLLILVKEGRAIADLTHALVALPWCGRAFGSKIGCDATGTLRVEQLGAARLVFVAAVMLGRGYVLVRLSLNAASYFASTTNIGDLILNAVAFEFVLSLELGTPPSGLHAQPLNHTSYPAPSH